MVVAVKPGSEAEFAGLCAAHGVRRHATGHGGGRRLEVEGSFAVPLDELAATHQGVLPALFG